MHPVGDLGVLEDPQFHIFLFRSLQYVLESVVTPISEILGPESDDSFPLSAYLSSPILVCPPVPRHIPYKQEELSPCFPACPPGNCPYLFLLPYPAVIDVNYPFSITMK